MSAPERRALNRNNESRPGRCCGKEATSPQAQPAAQQPGSRSAAAEAQAWSRCPNSESDSSTPRARRLLRMRSLAET